MHALARLVSPRLVSSRLLSSRFDSVRALAARLTDCWLGKHAVIPDNDNDNIAFSTILVPRSFGRFRFHGSRERLMRKHRGNRQVSSLSSLRFLAARYSSIETTFRRTDRKERRNRIAFGWATSRVDVDRSRTLSRFSRSGRQITLSGPNVREKRERKIGSDRERIQHPSGSLSRPSPFPFDPKKIQIARPIPVTIPALASSATELRDSPSTLG